jgi:cytochrome c oxidase subunit 3
MQQTLENRWSGGESPFRMGWQKMMMWWFIVTDGLLFAGFLAAYGFARAGSAEWPDRHKVFHISFLTTMTFILISSSATMANAVAAARERDWANARKFLLFTILGGLAFLGMQAYEWAAVIGDGMRLGANPWGDKLFGAYFFMMTGFHGTHVLLGVVVLLLTLLGVKRGKSTGDSVELAGLYWHFVDLVWVFIFGCFYLL